MRSLSIFFLAVGLLVTASGCSKPSDSASGSTPDANASGGAVASAAAAAPPGPGGTMTFGDGWEGGLVMHTITARGPRDALFIAKGTKLRVDVPEPDGRVAHTIFDSATKKLTVVMDSQHLALQMPIPTAAPGDAAKPPTVTRTGKHETIAGYDCEDWEIVAADGNHQSTCVATGLPFFDFSASAGPAGGRTWAEELRDENAFPLRMLDVDAKGKEISRMEVTKIAKRAVEDAAFEVPQGFDLKVVPGTVGATGVPVHPK